MVVKQWTNNLGYDVGNAEVRDLGNRLRAFVPIAPEHGIMPSGKPLSFPRYKVADFRLGTSPLDCINQCRERGIVRYEDRANLNVIPMLSA